MDDQSFSVLKHQVEQFVEGPGRALSQAIESNARCGPDVWATLREHGYLRLAAPRRLGGAGLTMVQYLTLLERFATLHGSLRMIIHVLNGVWRPLETYAAPAQRDAFVRPLISGSQVVTFTLTEPEAGTGTDIRTEARPVGGDYVLQGEKWLITFADVADYFLLFARLPGTRGHEGTVALLVPRDAPGLAIEPMAPSMGLAGTGHGHLYLSDCRIPQSHRLGAVGEGLAVAFHGFLDPSRLGIGMTTVGLAQRALDLAVTRVQTRRTFGQRLADRATIRARLAEMVTEIEAARQLCIWAGRRFDAGELRPEDAAKAKLFGSEMLQRVTDHALGLFGGIGYFHGEEMERIYRDARAQRFEEGTAEVQKAVIGRSLVPPERAPALAAETHRA